MHRHATTMARLLPSMSAIGRFQDACTASPPSRSPRMKRSLLVVDDDARVRSSLTRALHTDATTFAAVSSAEEALAFVATRPPDVVLSDVRMPGMDGVELLRVLHARTPEIDVILMTAFDDLPLVAMAMREGAVDFLVKPLDLHALRRVLDKVFDDRGARARALSDTAKHAVPRRLVGRDARMIEIFKLVGQVATNRTNVVIRGESGTARKSSRGPFTTAHHMPARTL